MSSRRTNREANPMAGPSRRARGDVGTDSSNDSRRKRRRKDQDESSNSDESNNGDDDLWTVTKKLLLRTCQTHEATPLYNFNPEENTLKRYAKRTLSDVLEMIPSGSVSFNRCSFKYFHPRTRNEDLNCEALHVQMLREDPAVDERGKRTTKDVFQALFLAPLSPESNRDRRCGIHRFPVVITRGPESILKAWKTSIAAQFHCIVVRECTLSPPELKIIVGNYLLCSSAERQIDMVGGKLFLEFQPETVQKGKIEAALPLAYFEEYMDGELQTEFGVTNVVQMWHEVLENLEGEIPHDFYTPVAKMRYKSFAIGSDGRVRGKDLTERQYRTLFLSLQWVIEEGYRCALRPRSLHRSRHRAMR